MDFHQAIFSLCFCINWDVRGKQFVKREDIQTGRGGEGPAEAERSRPVAAN